MVTHARLLKGVIMYWDCPLTHNLSKLLMAPPHQKKQNMYVLCSLLTFWDLSTPLLGSLLPLGMCMEDVNTVETNWDVVLETRKTNVLYIQWFYNNFIAGEVFDWEIPQNWLHHRLCQGITVKSLQISFWKSLFFLQFEWLFVHKRCQMARWKYCFSYFHFIQNFRKIELNSKNFDFVWSF